MSTTNEKTSLINCTGHPIMHRIPNTNLGLRSRTSNAIKDGDIHLFLFQATPQLDYCFMCSLSSISKLLARNLVDFRLDFLSRSPATWRMDYFLSKLWNDIRGGIDRRSFKGEFK